MTSSCSAKTTGTRCGRLSRAAVANRATGAGAKRAWGSNSTTSPSLGAGVDLGNTEAAVDDDRLSGDVSACRRRQPDRGGREFASIAQPAQDQSMRLALQVARFVFVGHLGFEESRSESVDPNALARAPLLRQIPGEPDDRGLACAVGRLWQSGGGDPQNAGN